MAALVTLRYILYTCPPLLLELWTIVSLFIDIDTYQRRRERWGRRVQGITPWSCISFSWKEFLRLEAKWYAFLSFLFFLVSLVFPFGIQRRLTPNSAVGRIIDEWMSCTFLAVIIIAVIGYFLYRWTRRRWRRRYGPRRFLRAEKGRMIYFGVFFFFFFFFCVCCMLCSLPVLVCVGPQHNAACAAAVVFHVMK